MKRVCLFLACLALTSLACLQSAAIGEQKMPNSDQLSVISEQATNTPDDAVTMIEIDMDVAIEKSESCAKVIADSFLHLRSGAGTDWQVIAYLKYAQVVRVINRDNSEWWKVNDGLMIGYARSKYLETVECHKGD